MKEIFDEFLNIIKRYSAVKPATADCKLCVHSVYSKYGGPFMTCDNEKSNRYNKLIPISGDTSNLSCSEFSEKHQLIRRIDNRSENSIQYPPTLSAEVSDPKKIMQLT